jgi:hypothetical protein
MGRMSDYLFRGHYLVLPSRMAVPGPAGWASTGTRNWTCLHREGESVHRWASGRNDGVEVLLIGYVLDPARPGASDADIVASIGETADGPSGVASRLHALSGRFVLLVDGPDGAYVFHDACGLRAVYYRGMSDGPVIASDPAVMTHFGLVESVQRPGFTGSAYHRTEPEWWLPSGVSLVRVVEHLTPNHYLDCSTVQAVRYYPRTPIRAADSESGVGSVIATTLAASIDAAVRRWRLVLPLTAGVDSRTALAACRAHLVDIPVYTLELATGAAPSADVAVAAELCGIAGVPHHVIRPQAPDADYMRAYVASTTNAHLDRRGANIWTTQAHFPGAVIINGNGLEIARCFYYPTGTHPAITSARQILDLVTGWRNVPFVEEAVTAWSKSALDVCQDTGVDVLDLFYWEHRMGSWASQNFMESGIVHEIFAPFNNRALLELMLSVAVTRRHAPDYSFYRDLWRRMWPALEEPPINPGARLRGVRSVLAGTGLMRPAKVLRQHLRRIGR